MPNYHLYLILSAPLLIANSVVYLVKRVIAIEKDTQNRDRVLEGHTHHDCVHCCLSRTSDALGKKQQPICMNGALDREITLRT